MRFYDVTLIFIHDISLHSVLFDVAALNAIFVSTNMLFENLIMMHIYLNKFSALMEIIFLTFSNEFFFASKTFNTHLYIESITM